MKGRAGSIRNVFAFGLDQIIICASAPPIPPPLATSIHAPSRQTSIVVEAASGPRIRRPRLLVTAPQHIAQPNTSNPSVNALTTAREICIPSSARTYVPPDEAPYHDYLADSSPSLRPGSGVVPRQRVPCSRRELTFDLVVHPRPLNRL